MKKFIAFVMILSLGMLTIGCTPPAQPKKTPEEKPAVTDKDKTPATPATPATPKDKDEAPAKPAK